MRRQSLFLDCKTYTVDNLYKMKKNILLPLLIVFSFFIISTNAVYAQNSYGGDSVCGSSSSAKCTVDDAKKIINGVVYNFLFPIGMAFLTMFIIFRILVAWKASVEGNASAWKDARNKISNAILGLIIITLVFGGFYAAILSMLGVDSWATGLLKLLSFNIVEHANAQTTGFTNPVAATSAYDFLLLFVNLTIRWFFLPAVIAFWVWTGFSFVEAQGKPEKLTKAKKLLFVSVGATLLILMTQGFLYAVRGTVDQVIGKDTQTQATSNSSGNNNAGTPDGRIAPEPNTYGATCQDSAGNYGTITSAGKCATRAGCDGKSEGGTCIINGADGTCNSKNGSFGCYASPGSSCKSVDGSFGSIGADERTCYIGGTR